MKIQFSSYTPIQESLRRAEDSLSYWFEEGKRILRLDNCPLKKLAGEVARLSTLLISGKRGNYMEDEGLLKAYFSFFFPQGFYRTFFVLDEILRLTDYSPAEGLKLNDFGSGPGASLLAAYEVFKRWNPGLLGMERSTKAIRLLKELAEKRIDNIRIRKGDFTKYRDSGNIAIFSSAISEIGRNSRFIRSVMDSHEILVIIEPGWRQGYELVMEISRILGMEPLLPCLGATCSLKGKDWCHAALPFSFPELTLRVNSLLRHKLRYLKFTYGVFSSKIKLKKSGARIISPLLKEKGKESFLVCERGRVVRIERLKNQACGDFDYVSCCDLISYEGEKKGNAIRLKELKIIR